MAPELLVLALEYYRNPLNRPGLSDVQRPLPDIIGALADAFGKAISGRQKATTAAALGTSTDELEAAVRFFLRQVLMAPGADHYRVLGLSHEATADEIRLHYQTLIRLLHPDRAGDDAEWAEAYAPRINEAYRVLRNEDTRRQYDAQLVPTGSATQGQSGGVRAVARGPAPGVRTGGRMPGVLVAKRNVQIASLAGILLLTLAVVVITRHQKTPVLQADPARVNQPTPGPAFLKGPATPGETAAHIKQQETQGPAGPRPDAPSSISPHPGSDTPRASTTSDGPATVARTEPDETPATAERAPGAADAVQRHPASENANVVAPNDDTPTGTPDANTPPGVTLTQLHPGSETPAAPATHDGVEAETRMDQSAIPEPSEPAPVAAPDPTPRDPEREYWITKTARIGASTEAEIERRETGKPDEPATASATLDSATPAAGPSGQPRVLDESVTAEVNNDGRTSVARIERDEVREPAERSPGTPDSAKLHPGDQPRPTAAADPAAAKRAGREHPETREAPKTASDVPDSPAPPPAGTQEYSAPGVTPQGIMHQLVATYEAGDIDGLVSLFTPDAEVNDGRGTAFIRRDYIELFSTTAGRRLALNGMTWDMTDDGTIRGKGAVAVSVKSNIFGPWRELEGTIRFELVRGKDGLRIARMLHEL